MKFTLLSAIALVLVALINNEWIYQKKLKLAIRNLPDEFEGFHFVMISDLHSKRPLFTDLAKKINALQPEAIVFCGDMVNETDHDLHVFADFLNGLDKTQPILYVFGNHEAALDRRLESELKELIAKHSILNIDNETFRFKKGNASLLFAGLTHPRRFYRNVFDDDYKTKAFAKEDCLKIYEPFTSPTILLAHNPLYFESYCALKPALILCGHIHGGMIRIPLIKGIFSPERSFFPKYDKGLYRHSDTTLFVSSGAGKGHFPFRLFNQAEIVEITLTRK